MDIFLTQDGSSIGPYSADELRRKIKAGEVSLEESAWSAEVGEWLRLELVLARAEGGSSAMPAPFAPERKKSSKLRPPGVAPGPGAGFAEPASVTSSSERRKEARRLGGATVKRPNPLAFLRWLSLIAVAGYLFAALLPWVKVNYDGASSEQAALALATVKTEEMVALPGTNAPPKYFKASKILLILATVLVALVTLLSISNARNEDAGTSGMGLILGVLAGLSLVGFGVIYGELFERQFAQTMIGDGEGGIEFVMGSGYYFALAAVALLVASVIVPQILRRGFIRSMMTTVVMLLLSAGLVYVGTQQLSSGTLESVVVDIEAMFEQGVDAVKGTIEKAKEIGGDKPESGE